MERMTENCEWVTQKEEKNSQMVESEGNGDIGTEIDRKPSQ